ncbi:hypothetical protein GCM10010275_27130 [Streptomyces litmocidini]|uniref:hypothetical protein n=1 Tax=Streptomyces litmocidini TaxID=67318 RepID=UPI0019900BEE|nr:hypothetical protein [Streptomyces litmocidini]GGU89275.1 hypothetical protein GCM10010275_27130 [Streptomyces litmocidini]
MNEFTPQELVDADNRVRAMAAPPEQLKAALQQAEGYRNFLATLTGLLTVVFVLKGQENLSKMTTGPRWWVIGLLAGAFLLLLLASWLMVSAVHERPGRKLPSGAEYLLRYEKKRARTIRLMTSWARWMGLLGVLAVSAASLITWIWPGPVA